MTAWLRRTWDVANNYAVSEQLGVAVPTCRPRRRFHFCRSFKTRRTSLSLSLSLLNIYTQYTSCICICISVYMYVYSFNLHGTRSYPWPPPRALMCPFLFLSSLTTRAFSLTASHILPFFRCKSRFSALPRIFFIISFLVLFLNYHRVFLSKKKKKQSP